MICLLCLFEVGIRKIIQEWLREEDRQVKLSFTVIFYWDEDVSFASGSKEHHGRHLSISSMVPGPPGRTGLWKVEGLYVNARAGCGVEMKLKSS